MAHGLTSTDSMFSVREMPWHGLGSVLDEYPASIDEALEKSGLGWAVNQRPLYVAHPVVPETASSELYGGEAPSGLPAGYVPQFEAVMKDVPEFRANVRSDTGKVLGIVSDDYKVVQNVEAFKFLDALIGSEMHFETAGSLHSGKRVWVLVRLPDFVEVGGDQVGTYVYCANSHDGSMAVTSAVTPVRVVCANTLGLALRRSEGSERTYKFRHTGDLAVKFDEARKVMGLTVKYAERFKAIGDELALQPFATWQFERVARELVGLNEADLGDRARKGRAEAASTMTSIFTGNGETGDTTGNSPFSKWAAVNAIGEYADWHRRYTKNTDQVARSFEDHDLKQRGLALVEAA